MASFYPQIINWDTEFPAVTLTIKTLRDSAIFAHKVAAASRTDFEGLKEILERHRRAHVHLAPQIQKVKTFPQRMRSATVAAPIR